MSSTPLQIALVGWLQAAPGRSLRSLSRAVDDAGGGASQTAVSAWVKGAARPSGVNLDAVAVVLGVLPRDVLLMAHGFAAVS